MPYIVANPLLLSHARTCCVCHTEVCVDCLHACAGAVQHIVDGNLAVKHTGAEHTRDGGTPLQAHKHSQAQLNNGAMPCQLDAVQLPYRAP